MPHTLCLEQLDELQHPRWPVDQLRLVCLDFDLRLHLWVALSLQDYAREQVADLGHEQRLVFVDELRQVHVTENSHHYELLAVLWVLTLELTECPEDGQDIPQAEIVMYLFELNVNTVIYVITVES